MTGRESVGCPKTTTRSISPAQRAVEQQPVAAEGVGAGARPAGRLGEQRPAGLLGEHPGRRAGVVAGDHDGARAERQRLGGQRVGPLRADRLGGCRRAAVPGRVRDQRLLQLDVEVHRRPAPAPNGPGRTAAAPGARNASTAAATSSRRCSSRSPGSSARSRKSAIVAEDPDLVGGLVGAGAAQPGRPVGGDARPAAAPACAASSTAGCRLATAVPEVQTTAARLPTLVMPEGEEAGGALVDAGVQPEPAVGRGVVGRERERGVAGAGREHQLGDAARDQGVDDGAGQQGGGVGGGGVITVILPQRAAEVLHLAAPGLPVRDPVRVGGEPGERARAPRRAGRPAASRRPAAAGRRRRRR